MTSAQQIVSTIFQITINPDPNFSVGPKVGGRPSQSWHVHVEDHQGGLQPTFQFSQGLLAGGGENRGEPQLGKHAADGFSDEGVIIHQEDGGPPLWNCAVFQPGSLDGLLRGHEAGSEGDRVFDGAKPETGERHTSVGWHVFAFQTQ